MHSMISIITSKVCGHQALATFAEDSIETPHSFTRYSTNEMELPWTASCKGCTPSCTKYQMILKLY